MNKEDEFKKMESYISILKKVGAMENLLKKYDVHSVYDIPFSNVESYYNSIMRKRSVKLKNIETGRFVCDSSGNVIVFDSIYECNKFIYNYGYGLNQDAFKMIIQYGNMKSKGVKFHQKEANVISDQKVIDSNENGKYKEFCSQLSEYIKQGLSPRNLRRVINESYFSVFEKKELLESLHL